MNLSSGDQIAAFLNLKPNNHVPVLMVASRGAADMAKGSQTCRNVCSKRPATALFRP